VIALGRLGWSLRRIEEATGVRREMAGDYLRSEGMHCVVPGLGTQGSGKNGHCGDRGRRRVKTGHRGDHRLLRSNAGG